MMRHYLHRFLKKALLSAGIAALVLSAVQATSAQSVTLGWNANPEPDVAGYRLHYGTASQTYTQVIDVGNSTTATVSGLQGGSVYFFALTAYNTVGFESLFTSEVAYAPPSQTPTPAPINISGTISYCPNPLPGPVPNVTLTLTGSASGSILSDVFGNYAFSSLASGGSYIVTPTKSALPSGSAGIDTVDVIATQRHFLNFAPLPPGCRLGAADVNGDIAINTVDVIAIQRFFLGLSIWIANVGDYHFTPTNRSYPGVVTHQSAQNYDTLIFGDVASPFADQIGGPSEPGADVGRVAEVALPEVAVDQFVTNFTAEVTTTTIDAGDQLVGFQGDFTFDKRVVNFQDEPVQNAGLTSGNWNVSANVLPGTGPIRTLRISAFSNDLTPLSGSGTLFNLNMIRVNGPPGASTALTWAVAPDQFIFIGVDLDRQAPGNAVPGLVTLEQSGNPAP